MSGVAYDNFSSAVSSFDPAKHFNSAPELVGRTYNRSSLETLASEKIEGSVGTMKVC